MEKTPSPLFDVVDKLLAPVPGDEPTGSSARYDPVMAEIRMIREADDPSLPQGEWERPLKKADWPLVVKLCSQTLCERSKDLQIAAWLTEAWIHLHQIDGLRAGIRLIQGLLHNYWDGVHPRQSEDGDYDARVAPLVWMNETLPLTLRLQVAMLPWPDRKPAFISLEDWTKAPLVTPPRKDGDTENETETVNIPSREDLILVGATMAAPALLQLREDLTLTMADWNTLNQLVDSHFNNLAPSLSRVFDTLCLIDRACSNLLSKRLKQLTSEPPDQPKNGFHNEHTVTSNIIASDSDHIGLFPKDDLHLASDKIRSRADAYRQLESIANFLQSIEPHSPTPYLVRRAVSWGRMPLPELMQEVLREEGDLNRLFNMLGLKP